MPEDDPARKNKEESSGVSRRDFLKISGISAAAVPWIGTKVVYAAGDPVKIYGPGKVPVVLTVNGKPQTLQIEPRVSLLDALRDNPGDPIVEARSYLDGVSAQWDEALSRLRSFVER